jgi:zinc transport system substrate-binding protein
MRYIITALLTSTALPSFAEVPTVVTDIPPVHALVAQVMGVLGTPVLLLDKGADEHDFQLRPSQAGDVADADLVVWIGPELTPWLETALDNRPEGAFALALLDAPATVRQAYSDTSEHADDDAEHEAGHDHAGADPHAWLDPGNGKIWLGLIAAELSRLDPDNSSTYAANAATAISGIDALDTEITAILAQVRDKPIVTFHDAFGYFAGHYGLNITGSIALGDASSPGAQRLTELRTTVESGDVLCIFPEVQHDPILVAQMAEGTGARIGSALDPVGSSLEAGPGAYGSLLKGVAQTIADCVIN